MGGVFLINNTLRKQQKIGIGSKSSKASFKPKKRFFNAKK